MSLPSYVQAGPSYVQAGPFSDPWLIPQTLGTVSLLQSVDKLYSFYVLILPVLPPVLVPRQSEYPKPQPPLPPPFQSAAEPPLPYNACFPFKQQARRPEGSMNMYMAGNCTFHSF